MMADKTTTTGSSAIPGFFEKDRNERLKAVADMADLDDDVLGILSGSDGGIVFEQADRMVENAIGTFALPLGIATNFRINGSDTLVPMVIEEPSVIAAASKGAKTARILGGFEAGAAESYCTGQIQLLGVDDAVGAVGRITAAGQKILDLANSKSATLSKMGKGAKKITCRTIEAPSGPMLVAELLVDVGDAMGANVTNTMCEAVAPVLEEISGGRSLLKILSNYSTQRTAWARATFARDAVGGAQVVDDIILAYEFADNDVYRAVTHNKGVMNGVVAVANATGQDSRAVEAAANAYAARTGRYRSLTEWSRNQNGDLVGSLKLPLAVGVVGGVAGVHPAAKACIRILGARTAGGLACIMVSAGLAQNYSALRALATDGIQKGHMKLHARNLAVAAGARPDEVDRISQEMIVKGQVSMQGAKMLLHEQDGA